MWLEFDCCWLYNLLADWFPIAVLLVELWPYAHWTFWCLRNEYISSKHRYHNTDKQKHGYLSFFSIYICIQLYLHEYWKIWKIKLGRTKEKFLIIHLNIYCRLEWKTDNCICSIFSFNIQHTEQNNRFTLPYVYSNNLCIYNIKSCKSQRSKKQRR